MNNTKSFIETQFPVSKISKESYSERKDVQSQTLTGLGKWWGRKPLILVRATILGLLIPASTDPQKDREIFLKILSMDDEGLWQRKERDLTISKYYELANSSDKEKYFLLDQNIKKVINWHPNLSQEEKIIVQKKLFNSLSYDSRLSHCCRPEQLSNLQVSDWIEINSRRRICSNITPTPQFTIDI